MRQVPNRHEFVNQTIKAAVPVSQQDRPFLFRIVADWSAMLAARTLWHVQKQAWWAITVLGKADLENCNEKYTEASISRDRKKLKVTFI